MHVLITGACGYVARNLIRELKTRGRELRLLDRVRPEEATMFDPDSGGCIADPLKTHWPALVGAVTDPDTAKRAVEGVDAVVHLAAGLKGDPTIGFDTFHTNACGTFAMIDAARQAGVARFLCASSINTFGTFWWRISNRPVVYDKLPLTEDFDPVFEDPYSLSKFVNEQTCAAFHRAYGITTAAFRFAGVWNQVMHAQKRKEGLPPTKEWSDHIWQWVHVEDLVRGIRQALEQPDLPGYGVYTLGAADTLAPEPSMELLERFKPELAKKLDRPLKGREPLLSIDRARRTFGYAPQNRMGD